MASDPKARPARRFRSRVLECLELRRRHLTAIDFRELGRPHRIGHRAPQMASGRQREEIEDLPLGRLQAHRRNQDNAVEDSRIGRHHLGRDKCSRRKTDHIYRFELMLPQGL